MIAWGRYAGLMDFNANTGMVTLPEKDKEEEEGQG
jgi:NitT/TauT family transport system ATP-binding protein